MSTHRPASAYSGAEYRCNNGGHRPSILARMFVCDSILVQSWIGNSFVGPASLWSLWHHQGNICWSILSRNVCVRMLDHQTDGSMAAVSCFFGDNMRQCGDVTQFRNCRAQHLHGSDRVLCLGSVQSQPAQSWHWIPHGAPRNVSRHAFGGLMGGECG